MHFSIYEVRKIMMKISFFLSNKTGKINAFELMNIIQKKRMYNVQTKQKFTTTRTNV
jgi:hypothetical protein